jgi:hypothetical protein
MSQTSPAAGKKLKVFISYSRQDLAFADQLIAVLELHGYLPAIDRKGIHGAERWEERLGQLMIRCGLAPACRPAANDRWDPDPIVQEAAARR